MPNLLLTMWDTIKSSNIGILVAAGLGMFAIIGGLSMLSYHYTLSGIKSRTVGDGQHGTARWATDKEIRKTYAHVPFKVRDWRKGVSLPTEQGLVLGCKGILMDNCQDVICGGFAPNSEAADTFSKALGSRTVLSGSVSRGKNDPSQSLQMMERPLLTADELKSIPKGSFIVQKTGCHPMRTRLRLFLEWGITFEEEYRVEEQAARRVSYADQNALTRAIVRKYPPKLAERQTTRSVKGEGQLHDAPVQEMVVAEDIDYDRMPHKRTPYNLPRQEVNR